MNAIILAAGMGTRLMPITAQSPKSLIKLNDKPLIETQIEYLLAIGVERITIVVGYLAEHFDYLKEKYGATMVFNNRFDTYNNIYTMSLVINEFADTYVMDADVFMARNFLNRQPATSRYFSGKKDTVGEWALICDNDDNVTAIQDSAGIAYIMSGISYWTKKDAVILTQKLNEKILHNKDDWHNLYWDDIVKENIDALDVKIEKIESNDWYEVDSVKDYHEALTLFPNMTTHETML